MCAIASLLKLASANSSTVLKRIWALNDSRISLSKFIRQIFDSSSTLSNRSKSFINRTRIVNDNLARWVIDESISILLSWLAVVELLRKKKNRQERKENCYCKKMRKYWLTRNHLSTHFAWNSCEHGRTRRIWRGSKSQIQMTHDVWSPVMSWQKSTHS